MAAPAPAGDVTVLLLPDAAARADLATFVGRAKRIDAAGAIRLAAHGPVLAVTAAALHGGGGPTVLAMRALALAAPSEVDVTVTLAAVADRLARADLELPVPPVEAAGPGWAGLAPPRGGWELAGALPGEVLERAAREGIAEVAAGAPEGSGAAAVARLRAAVWGRDLPGAPGVPAGAAFAAHAFGFLGDATVHTTGPWTRLTGPRGHILTRRPALL